ncbi:unnamed protein product [Ixodes hexagonus]
MALYHRSSEKRRILNDFRRQEEEVIGSLVSRLSNRPTSPKTQMEQEKRIRREIANSNERRRMQSINAGFQSLRTLLPHHDGEKLSKAAILQHTAEYIYQLEQEKTRLLSQNSQLKRLVSSQMSPDSDGSSSDSPLPKRKKGDNSESALDDEGIAGMSLQEAECREDFSAREIVELRMQLDRERQLRLILEEQTRSLEAQLYPDRPREPTPHHKVKAEPQEGSEAAKLSASRTSPEKTTILTPAADHLPPASPHFSPPHHLPEGAGSPPRPPPAHPAPALELPPVASPAADLPQDLSTHSALASSATPPTPSPAMAPTIKDDCRSACASPYHASTSRQNLETIVEAIRHLEGDHLFRDDEPSLPLRCAAEDGGILRSGLNVVVIHEPAAASAVMRQQVITQCGAPVQQQTRRPGVIVANHS